MKTSGSSSTSPRVRRARRRSESGLSDLINEERHPARPDARNTGALGRSAAGDTTPLLPLPTHLARQPERDLHDEKAQPAKGAGRTLLPGEPVSTDVAALHAAT